MNKESIRGTVRRAPYALLYIELYNLGKLIERASLVKRMHDFFKSYQNGFARY